MTAVAVDAIEARACLRKSRYSVAGARQRAAELTRPGQRISPYRCVFCGCWHVGHTPSMESIETLAAAIRERAYPSEPAAS